MVTSPHNRNCGGRCGESAWDEWGSVLRCRGSCGKRCGGGVGKCLGVWGEIRKDVWGVEKCGRVYGVSGEGVRECMGRGSVLAYGERMWGGVGKCFRVWGPNTLPHISFVTSPFPTSPLTFPTPQHTFLHLPLIPLPTCRPTPQHIFLLSPHLPSPSQSVAKLPCDKVSVAKLLWRSYHVAKLLATEIMPPPTLKILAMPLSAVYQHQHFPNEGSKFCSKVEAGLNNSQDCDTIS